MKAKTTAALVKKYAIEQGFSDVGITDLRPNAHGEHLRRWLSLGMAGTMSYMHRQAMRRLEPARILPGAERCVVVLRNHFSPDGPRRVGTGRVAKYARGKDYHEALKEPLLQLAEYLITLGDADTIARPYVDAGPVPERELAQRAGLGWIGKNSMLVSPTFGSHLFIAVVLTNLDLAMDHPFRFDRCGNCERCLRGCPTEAIRPGRFVDSRRCISYLTIEYRGEIPYELAALCGDWILGCDVCQDVCPWNEKFAQFAADPVLEIDTSRAQEDLDVLGAMNQAGFEKRFGKTALERPGFGGLRRNVRIAQRNTAEEPKAGQGFTFPSGDR